LLPLRPIDVAIGTDPTTAIELPYRVLLGPAPDARLFHRNTALQNTDPSTDFAWTGLWSTRLAANGSEGNGGTSFCAVPYPVPETPLPTFRTTLDERERGEIASLSQGASPRFVISSPECVLSAFGASAQLKSNWPPGASTILGIWEHHTVIGRDTFVRSVEEGFLFRFGHRASKTKIFRRDFSVLKTRSDHKKVIDTALNWPKSEPAAKRLTSMAQPPPKTVPLRRRANHEKWHELG
jgi:hypothetical protein